MRINPPLCVDTVSVYVKGELVAQHTFDDKSAGWDVIVPAFLKSANIQANQSDIIIALTPQIPSHFLAASTYYTVEKDFVGEMLGSK